MRKPPSHVLMLLLALASGIPAGASQPALSHPGSDPSGGELRFCIRADPKSFDPFLVYDDASEAIRYLTGATLLRLNRKTQDVVPELAASWKILDAGRRITFALRPGVRFSDGSPVATEDVVFSLKTFFDPRTHAPDADSFGVDAAAIEVRQMGPAAVGVSFPKAIAGLERLFDSVAIVSATSRIAGRKPSEVPVAGPFQVAEYRSGSYVLLTRNRHYWKTDAQGVRLPYLDAIRLYIQTNSAMEVLRFQHGDTDLISNVDPESYLALSQLKGIHAFDLGPSLDSEQLWFNQTAAAPIPAYKKRWFRSKDFRTAISLAIDRADLARIGYFARASASAGPTSPANAHWFNPKLSAPLSNRSEALLRLEHDGFHRLGASLFDRDGNAVEFSVITNGGNKVRERLASLVQADLAQIGIKLNIATFDFPALLQRITKTFDYESCLLGLVNSDLDPNGQMNVWLSSGSNHAWNPGQLAPATPWEKEIDRLMKEQASDPVPAHRKAAFDRVQEISREENPALYLITKHALTVFGPAVANPSPAVLFPQAFWNADQLYLVAGSASKRRQLAGLK